MNEKLRCVIVEDELPGLAYLRLLCDQIPFVEVVKAFSDPAVFLKEEPELEYDACILDIEMPGMNGLQVAQLLANKQVIITTAYRDYAPEAFDLDVTDYVRKPIQKDRLEKALTRARERLQRRSSPEFILVNSDRGKARINTEELVCILSPDNDKRDKVAILENHQRLLLKNIAFRDLLEMLPGHFLRVSKSAVVSLPRVRLFNQEEVWLSQGPALDHFRVPVGDSYRAALTARLRE